MTSISPPAPLSIGMSLPKAIPCRALGFRFSSPHPPHPPICFFSSFYSQACRQMPAALRAAFPEQGAKQLLSSFATWLSHPPTTPHTALTSTQRRLRKNLPASHTGQRRGLLWR